MILSSVLNGPGKVKNGSWAEGGKKGNLYIVKIYVAISVKRFVIRRKMNANGRRLRMEWPLLGGWASTSTNGRTWNDINSGFWKVYGRTGAGVGETDRIGYVRDRNWFTRWLPVSSVHRVRWSGVYTYTYIWNTCRNLNRDPLYISVVLIA